MASSQTTFIDTVFRAIDRISRPVSRMQRVVGRFTRAARRNLERVSRVSDKVASGIKKGFMAAAAAMTAFGVATAKVIGMGADFEQNIVNAAVKFPGNIRKGSEAFKELEDAARKTGASTEFSATQSAEALNFLAMAGFNSKQAIAALPGVVDLATASGVGLAEATDMATDTLGAFNMMSDDAIERGKNLAHVNDVMVKATTSANMTMEDMFEAIKAGGSIVEQAGFDIETFAAMTGIMAGAGKKGEAAGTTLKNVFTRLQAPPAAAAAALEKLFGKGGVIDKSTGNMKDPIRIIGMLNEKLDGMGKAKRAGIVKDIFGAIALQGANVLLATGEQKLEDFRKKMYAAQGAAKEMASVMRNTTRGSLNSLNSAVEGFIISLFKLEDKGIKNVVDRFTDWVRANERLIVSKIGEWLNMIIDNFASIWKWTKRIAKGVAIFFALHSVLKLVIGVLGVVNALMAANPIGLIIVAVATLIAGFIALIHWSEEVAKFFDKMPYLIKAIVFSIAPLTAAIWGIAKLANKVKDNWEPIETFFKTLVEAIRIVWEPIGTFFEELWEGVVKSVEWAVEQIKELLEPVTDWIADMFEPIKEFFGDTGNAIWDKTFGDLWNEARRNVAKQEGEGLAPLPSDVSDENTALYEGEQTKLISSESTTRSESESKTTLTLKLPEDLEAEVTEGSLGPGILIQTGATA